MKGRRAERRSRCARDTLASRRSPSSLLSVRHPFLSAVFPMGNVVTYRSSWKPAPIEMETQPWDALRPLSFSRFPRHRFSPSLSLFSVPLPRRQRANVFASHSLRRFQIISRPIVLLLTTQRPLCPLPPIALAAKSSPHRPRAPSLPSRPVSLV